VVKWVTVCCKVGIEWTSGIEKVTIMGMLNLNAMIGIIIFEKKNSERRLFVSLGHIF